MNSIAIGYLVGFALVFGFGLFFRYHWLRKKFGPAVLQLGSSHELRFRIVVGTFNLILAITYIVFWAFGKQMQYLVLGICFLILSLANYFQRIHSLDFREKGIVSGIRLAPWDRIRFYIWDHLDPNHLSITWEEGKDKTKTFDLDVKPKQRDEVLRILKERTDAEEVRAVV